MSQPQSPRDPKVITDKKDLAEALIDAFVNGNAKTSQGIVDGLGDHVNKQ